MDPYQYIARQDDYLEEDENDKDDVEIPKHECDFIIKYCCVDFKIDIWQGNRRTTIIAILKIFCYALLLLIIGGLYMRYKQLQQEYIHRSYMAMMSDDAVVSKGKIYQPTQEDLSTRPLPNWYDRAKIGIFVDWGLSSVTFNEDTMPRKGEHRCEHHNEQQIIREALAKEFTVELFDPTYWAKLFAASGAKYVVMTAKNEDGYCLFASDRSPGWSSAGSGPHRDLVQDLGSAVRKAGLKFGAYYSVFEPSNIIHVKDFKDNANTSYYGKHKVWPDLKQLVNEYQVDILDLRWRIEKGDWGVLRFLAWLYSHSVVKDKILVIDYLPYTISWANVFAQFNRVGKLNPDLENVKYEFPVFLLRKERSNIDVENVLTVQEMLMKIVHFVSIGDNVVLLIKPTKDGLIPLAYQKRLLEMGKWLKKFGEAIYNTHPWKRPIEAVNSQIFYTCKLHYEKSNFTIGHRTAINYKITAIYAIIFKWPYDNVVRLRYPAYLFVNRKTKVELLDRKGQYLNSEFAQKDLTLLRTVATQQAA